MNILLLGLFLFCFSAWGGDAPRWGANTFMGTPLDHFYIGVSDGRKSLTKAKEEAYLEAVKEAVRHNFGFNQKLVANFHANLKNIEHNESMLIHQEEINLQGITPVKEHYTKNDDGTYKVWRQIKYPRKYIEIEKKRLKDAKPIEGIANFVTNPSGADIYINDNKMGRTPLLNVHHLPGTYRIRYELKGYFSKSHAITVKINENTPAKTISLDKIPKKKPKRKIANEGPGWIAKTWNFIFSSEKSEVHRFTYSPVVNEDNKTWCHLLPFSYDRHYIRKFSLGIDAHYMYDESGDYEDPDTESLFHGSTNFKIWPFRNDLFSLGFGAEYNYRFYRKKTIVGSGGIYGNKTKKITEKESHGIGALGTFLLPFNSKRTRGLQIDYRKIDLNDSSRDFVSVGVYFEF